MVPRPLYVRTLTRTVLFLLLIAAAPATLLAQAPGSLSPDSLSLSGRVLDGRTSTPVPGAAVAAVDMTGAVLQKIVTDAAGHFRITGLPAGRYRLRVTALGYAAMARQAVDLDDEPVVLRVVVEPKPADVEGIRVSAERRSLPFRGSRQVISGKVLDASTAEPVDGMDVVVRDHSGGAVGRTLTDRDGRFFFIVDDPGLYRLAVARIGYDSTATADVAVAPAQDLYLELRVQPMALGMAPIQVTAPRTVPLLEASGFYGRMRRGQGSYLTPRDLDRLPGAYPSQFLRRLPGVTVTAGGEIVLRGIASLGELCRPMIILDGVRMAQTELDDVIPANWIDGIEVYRGPATVPAQWRDNAVCGVIAVWTKH